MASTTLASLTAKVEEARKEHAKRTKVRKTQMAMINTVDRGATDLAALAKAALKLDLEVRWKERIADQKRAYEDAAAALRTSCETQSALIAWSRKRKLEVKEGRGGGGYCGAHYLTAP